MCNLKYHVTVVHNKIIFLINDLNDFFIVLTKRGLPHTSNSMNLEDYNLIVKADTNLRFSPSINLCWFALQPKFQANSLL